MIVYMARNRLNGKGYVGKTKRTLEQRVKEHAHAAEIGSQQPFHRAIRKHGFEAFEWFVLADDAQTEQQLNEQEVHQISRWRTFGPGGYNATKGGDGVMGWSPSPEHREKIRQAHLGEKNHNYGKSWGRMGPWSEETKQKMREAAVGREHTQETKEKISEALRQRVRKTRTVIQYDMNGNVVATYPSMRHAAEATGNHKDRIGDCCRGTRESHGGYRWCYLEEQKGLR